MNKIYKTYKLFKVLTSKNARYWVKKNGLKWYINHDFYEHLYLDYFIRQSEIYPYWWRNFEWWDKNLKNPLYLHKWKDKSEN